MQSSFETSGSTPTRYMQLTGELHACRAPGNTTAARLMDCVAHGCRANFDTLATDGVCISKLLRFYNPANQGDRGRLAAVCRALSRAAAAGTPTS